MMFSCVRWMTAYCIIFYIARACVYVENNGFWISVLVFLPLPRSFAYVLRTYLTVTASSLEYRRQFVQYCSTNHFNLASRTRISSSLGVDGALSPRNKHLITRSPFNMSWLLSGGIHDLWNLVSLLEVTMCTNMNQSRQLSVISQISLSFYNIQVTVFRVVWGV